MQSIKRLVPLAALGALATGALGCLPAAAQYYPAPHVYMPAPPPPPNVHGVREVDAAVRSLGLRPVSHVRIRGPIFVVDAMGQEGSVVRVSIDRYTGRVTQIVRIGRSAPQTATVPEPYDSDEEDYADYEPSRPHGGPSVITRRGIEARDLPPRSPEITGSVSRNALNGVPKEFRGEQARPAPRPPQRLAARSPEPSPRAAPLPKARPADAPAVAQAETQAPPAAKPAPAKPAQSPEVKQDIEKFPPVQGFE
jgi:hypothetical protein